MTDTDPLPTLSPSEARQIDETCDRFEAVWKAGLRPHPEEYLSAVTEPVRLVLLRQLLLLDWDYRRHAGEEPATGDYQRRFPRDSSLVEDVSRAMNESPVSPPAVSDGPVGQDTTWSDDRTSVFPEEAEALAKTGTERYELVQEVGQGGIGIVFRGRDRLLGRELAVKVLREAYQDKPDARRRFIEEARVGSRLQHPAIVPVYELGWFNDRRPFITMKLVNGHTLAALLKERVDAGQDLPRFLGVFEQVCQAMAYAHMQAVVHRDLKPANIMVGAFGEVQVMDWGFARMLDENAAPSGAASVEREPNGSVENRPTSGRNRTTLSGTMMGTPAYMSPEQARGEAAFVDRRADVFALGAILCEILTGRPPYAGDTVDEICHKAIDGDLSDAFARLDSCTADEVLRELAKRSLAVEREVRPADAGIVAKALATYFASAQERLRQVQLAGAAAEARAAAAQSKVKAERRALRLTLAPLRRLLCGATVTAWQAIVATHAKTEALASAEKEKKAKETAEAKEAESRTVLEFVQKHILAAARPEGWPGGLGHDVTLRRALKAALAAVDQNFANQPLVEARVRHSLGDSFWFLGEADVAAAQYLRARAIHTEQLGSDHPKTLSSMNNLANAYAALGRHAEALELREETLAIQKAKLGRDHLETLTSMNNLATSYSALGRDADAFKLHEETLALQRAKLGPEHPDTLASMNNLAMSYFALGQFADALKLHQETLALRKAKLGPTHPETLRSMMNVATGYTYLGRYADGARLHEETFTLRKTHLGPEHPDTLSSMNSLATSYSALGRHAEALKLFESTLAIQKVNLGPEHPSTLEAMNNLAHCYNDMRRYVDALKLNEETLSLCKAKLGPEHICTLSSMTHLADSYAGLGRHLDALKLREETLALQKVKLGRDHINTLNSISNLAISYTALRRYADAAELHEETLALRKVKLGPEHPDTVKSMSNLANCYALLGRYAEALPIREQALALRKVHLGPNHPDTLNSMWRVASNLIKLDRGTEAVPILDECLQRATGRPVHPLLIPDLVDLRLRHFEKAKDAEGCRTTAQMWENLHRSDSDSFYQAAVCHAVTSEAMKSSSGTDGKAPAADTTRLAKVEADQAMAWLQKAVAAGYKDMAKMKKDKDFDGLRDRADFKKLLTDVDSNR